MFTNKTFLCFLFICFFLVGRAQRVYEIDARAGINVAGIRPIPMEGTNPAGVKLSANNKYFEKNDRPWFPVMGELHYNRVLPQYWEEEILKMKNAGLSIVATYVFWNEHEITPGVWDWKNNRDLRQFVELCAKHDMYVWLRIGPWSHGEQLNGGYPDWIQKMKHTRSNDPEYLAAASQLFDQIATQTKGLFFKDGGPLIGVQLENEYASGQPEHISKLKEMALQAGITPVFWSVTANTVFDDTKMEVIPLQGAYAYRGWEKAGGKATKDFLYGDDQWIMTDALGKVFYDATRFPHGLCEQGAGSQLTYNNRFIVDPGVIEAHAQNQVGRGMNMIGYYMFHGGTQTPGLKEPACPESYDFQAPISEFGMIRPSYKYLKILHNFINDFGSDLAQMVPIQPVNPVRDETDTLNLRYIARIDKDNSGFLFLCNTQVRIKMPDKRVVMKVKLPEETITFPSVLIKGQTTAILPFNLQANGLMIKYVTAQPLARLNNGDVQTIFFQKLPGTPVQLSVAPNSFQKFTAKGWTRNQAGNGVQFKQDANDTIQFTSRLNKTIRLIFLSRAQAENTWRINRRGNDYLVITNADVMVKDDKLVLTQLGNSNIGLKVYPSGTGAILPMPGLKTATKGWFDIYNISTPLAGSTVQVHQQGKEKITISLPKQLARNEHDIFLKVTYRGGQCNLTQNNQLITDNLFNGTPWVFGIKRFLSKGDITLQVQPWNDNITGVPAGKVQEIMQKGAGFEKTEIIPQYDVELPMAR